jgi:hypothetical protein
MGVRMSQNTSLPKVYQMPSRLKHSKPTPRKPVTIYDVEDLTECWRRLPHETKRAYEAFRTFLSLNSDKRSLGNTAQQFGVSKSLIKRWSARWAWLTRFIYWNREQEKLRFLHQTEERARMAKEQEEWMRRKSKMAMVLQTKAAEALFRIKPEDLNLYQIVKLFTLGILLEEIALGIPDPRLMNLQRKR